MYRKLFGTLACALVLGAFVLAEDLTGKITKVDPDKDTITLTKDGKETEYTVAKDAKLPKAGKKDAQREGKLKDIKNKLEKVGKDGKKPDGLEVKVTVEKKDGKDVVTKIEYKGAGKNDKKDKEEKKDDKNN